ncbi:nucleoside/nucleotide kinase family protein [Couchioplanes azureus]|uniref:nucleoside/nucleotide kinase family protein n=1 Tax=Couchioplanes caeruleus TaxID=56438 RepID=UPI001670B7E1|nr:nucleoside/nucleotide kinase family protein [Couchioplanes caeruleus]GGQ62342.1 nucleoside/nucleotide kinase family protein [Couchioplanes caeruleus subsp. azureus]
MTFEGLVRRARALTDGSRRAVLGIVGEPGAGKTTLAEELCAAIAAQSPPGWVAHVPMDGFHLADVELDRLGNRDRKGAPDTFDALGYAALLRRLREDTDEIVYAPGFERVIEQPIAGAIPVHRTARLIVSEGNYLLLEDERWSRVRPLCDEIWYADLDRPTRLDRLIARHIRFGKDASAATAWATGTDERNAEIIAATRHRADLVVPASLVRAVGTPPPEPGRVADF